MGRGECAVKPRVLFVDDEPELLESVCDALRKKPYRIVTASSGKEALARLEADAEIRVVVSDERMPEMTGHEFLGQVRRNHPQTVRVMLTGQADMSAIVSAINDGEIFRFLSKPCAAETLHEVIELALQITQRMNRETVEDPDEFLRKTALNLLEERHPGITEVERGTSGAIVINERPSEIDALLASYRH